VWAAAVAGGGGVVGAVAVVGRVLLVVVLLVLVALLVRALEACQWSGWAWVVGAQELGLFRPRRGVHLLRAWERGREGGPGELGALGRSAGRDGVAAVAARCLVGPSWRALVGHVAESLG
jgi:hypothetical protein